MGVLGFAQTQSLQPRGHVPSTVVRHCGLSEVIGPTDWQQSCPAAHQVAPQQTVPGGPNSAEHERFWHWPLTQMGLSDGHDVPHEPQFVGSFPTLRHEPEQHEKPLEVQF